MAITLHSSPPVVALSRNPMIFDFSTTAFVEDFIGLHFKVFVFDDVEDDYVSIAIEKRVALDEDAHAKIDISNLLAWNPEKAFTFPGSLTDIVTKRNDLRKQYYIQYSEKYGIPLAEHNSTDSTDFYVLSGGLSNIVRSRLNQESTDWWTEYCTGLLTFLSNTKTLKSSDVMADERLYFMAKEDVAGLFLYIKVYYEDYPNGITRLIGSIINIDQYDVYEIDASFITLGIGFGEDSGYGKVIKYDVYLLDTSNDPYSEVKTFVMDPVYNPNVRHFMFNNSFGVPEGVRFSGLFSAKSGYNSELAKFILPDNSLPSDHSLNYTQLLEQRSFTLNSGWLTKDDLYIYREFLASKRKYWLLNTMALPVVVKDSDILTDEDHEHLYQVTIEFSFGFEDETPGDDLEPEELTPDQYGDGTELTSDAIYKLNNILTAWEDSTFGVGDITFDDLDIINAVSAAPLHNQEIFADAQITDKNDFTFSGFGTVTQMPPTTPPQLQVYDSVNAIAASANEVMVDNENEFLLEISEGADYTDLRLRIFCTGLDTFFMLENPHIDITSNFRLINVSFPTFWHRLNSGVARFISGVGGSYYAQTIAMTDLKKNDILIFKYNLTRYTSVNYPKIVLSDDDTFSMSDEITLRSGNNFELIRVPFDEPSANIHLRFTSDAASAVDFLVSGISLQRVNINFLKQWYHENNG